MIPHSSSFDNVIFEWGFTKTFAINQQADVSCFGTNKKLEEKCVKQCAQFHDSLLNHPHKKFVMKEKPQEHARSMIIRIILMPHNVKT